MPALLELSTEILHYIVECLYKDANHDKSLIFPLSASCWTLRDMCYPILFRRVNLIWEAAHCALEPCGLVSWLSAHAQILQYVYELSIENDDSGAEIEPDLNHHVPFLTDLVPTMTRLRRITLTHMYGASFNLLKSLNVPINVELKIHQLNPSQVFGFKGRGLLLRSVTPQTRKEILHNVQGKPRSAFWNFMTPACLNIANADSCIALQTWRALDFGQATEFNALRPTLTNLVELHVLESTTEDSDDRTVFYQSITPWQTLLRLNITGMLSLGFASSGMKKLSQLQTLCISTAQRAVRPCSSDCGKPSWTPSDVHRELFEHLKLPRLQHVEVDFVCGHISVESFANPGWMGLNLVADEVGCVREEFEKDCFVRSPVDIRWMAKHMPRLLRLEINMANLRNLFDPFAVIGVDIAAEVYSQLEALSKIPTLEILRLCPPYIDPSSPHAMMTQPVTDEQAVKIYQYLREQGSRLKLLIIGPSFVTPSLRMTFSPMSWIVRDGGSNRTILTTHQPRKAYELEQIWIGDRKLSTQSKKYAFRKSWLPPFGGWEFPMHQKDDPDNLDP